MSAELQLIPARHGTATFVPAGQTIKIINTSGTQVIDTWAFALPKPDGKKGEQPKKAEEEKPKEEQKDESKQKETSKQETPKQDASQQEAPKATPKKGKKSGMNLPTQEEAEQATQQGIKEGEDASKDTPAKKSTWSSYVPTVSMPSLRGYAGKGSKPATEQQKDSLTWASYFPSGKGFSSYIPNTAKDTVSSFAASHKRDPNKTYLEQLTEFSRTPVGATGLAVLSGSGYGGSVLAGYQAWNAQNAANVAPMEFMSMTHCRAATLHIRPKVNDTLVSNLREPLLTLVEDTSPGIHDTLIAACDPARYKGLGVENWEEHGSCAENLVLALKEINERAGLKGAKAVGADITINSVPAPLNLFMNIPWDDSGTVSFSSPAGKANEYVRFKAERDLVLVMSACPQDILDINNGKPTDAHFIVEEEEQKEAMKRTSRPPVRKRPPPRKISSSHATSTIASEGGPTPVRKPLPQKKVPAQKKAAPNQSDTAKPAAAQATTTGTDTAKPTPAKAPAKKKPVPPPVAPQKQQASAPEKQQAPAPAKAATGAVEKKKPRKLNPKPKADG